MPMSTKWSLPLKLSYQHFVSLPEPYVLLVPPILPFLI
jgi:hypothetical protein